MSSVRSLVLALAGLMLLSAAVLAEGLLPSFADIVEKVAPAVVNISSTRELRPRELPQAPPGSPLEEFFREFLDRDGGPRRTYSLGSGFIVDPRGYVVTNNHVIEDATEIEVVLQDESRYRATVVGRDRRTDLAVLKIDRPEPFPYVQWADSDRVRVGDWVIAIGNPFGLGTSVTVGVVSARGRDIRADSYVDFFQIDAAINRGNSGGPSFDLEGRVFGVNTAIFSPSGTNIGIGFAIPSNIARRVVEDLIEHGRVIRAWLGVKIQTVTPAIAESLGLDRPRGALVSSVVPGGPAEAAGIRPGDVVLELAGHAVERMRDLPRIVADTPVGSEVEVVLWRRGEEVKVRVVLAELPSEAELARLEAQRAEGGPATRAELPELGLVVGGIDAAARERFRLPEDARGVVVLEVAEGGPAARAGVRTGDRILEVDQEEVGSPPELVARIGSARQEGRRAVLLLIEREGEPQFVSVPFAE
ncbi:Periplasmic serine endoprotease DegP [bacterium HR39]|nr:Periplasmic serine endoprotease DegP [bacterium HR39]